MIRRLEVVGELIYDSWLLVVSVIVWAGEEEDAKVVDAEADSSFIRAADEPEIISQTTYSLSGSLGSYTYRKNDKKSINNIA